MLPVKSWLLLLTHALIIYSIFGQKPVQHVYNFLKTENKGEVYVYDKNIFVGDKMTGRIILYTDGLFEWEKNFMMNLNELSVGKWRVQSDSILILNSNSIYFNRIFKRKQRDNPKSAYPFFQLNQVKAIFERKAMILFNE